jgi:hypothetical protein
VACFSFGTIPSFPTCTRVRSLTYISRCVTAPHPLSRWLLLGRRCRRMPSRPDRPPRQSENVKAFSWQCASC